MTSQPGQRFAGRALVKGRYSTQPGAQEAGRGGWTSTPQGMTTTPWQSKQGIQNFSQTNTAKPFAPFTNPVASGSSGSAGGKGHNGNYTDNDVITSGSNNNIRVDNSVFMQAFGGNSRSFTYNGGMGESSLYDSPVSAATMGGHYDVDDSAKASNEFVSKYMGANKVWQDQNDKAYRNSRNTDYARQSQGLTPFSQQLMQQQLEQEPLIQRQRGKVDELKLFGDTGRWHEDPIKFKMPEAPDPIESNVEEIGDKYSDKIKGILDEDK